MASRRGIKFMKVAIGFAGGVGLCSGVAVVAKVRENGNSKPSLLPTALAASIFSSANFGSSGTAGKERHPSPSATWDINWDRREPDSLIRSETDGKLPQEELKKLKPTATRHIFMIRHGHYFTDGAEDTQRKLTLKGCEQAVFTGHRLAELNFPYTLMYNSTMTRARETADIIAKHLPEVPREECSMLREGAPIKPEPPAGHWKPDVKQFYEDGARIEAAFRKYFHRADADQATDSYDVLVCHANVIRYFVCRAMQFPPEAWLRMSLHHGSITWMSIRPSGRVSLRTLGDAGHIPPDKLSVS
ncbi:serine/threonine-protein phosphatase PGAM5, mitochondrial-like isoform X1 [Apostichopus japonicus]|uniref:serine/threonine-protein phosphatase PGAM5, mitochondrial-like isoform X1 n=1 Tax=Stichopus japonicus TaxID=307972 RepID=UPI003AB33318